MKKVCFLALVIGLILPGCGRQSFGKEPWKEYQQRKGCTVQAEIVCNLGERVNEFSVAYEYHRDEPDIQKILEPEQVAGIAMTLEEGRAAVVQYEKTELESAMPEREGLTPADAIFSLLQTLKTDYPEAVSQEKFGETAVTRATYRSEEGSGEVRREVLLAEDGALVYAEVFLDHERILQMTFSNFMWTE